MNEEEKSTELQILQAAEQLFLERGFAHTTTGQIAKLAGCNQALVHYYYRTKDNLFEKVFEEKVRLMVINLLQEDISEVSFQDKLSRMIGLHFDFLMNNPKLFSFILNELFSNPDRIQSLAEKIKHYPSSIFIKLNISLHEEIKKGNIRPITIDNLILTIVSLNATPFLFAPIFQKAMHLSDKEVSDWLKQRKSENLEMIMSRLKV